MSKNTTKELREAITALVRKARKVYPTLQYDVRIPGYEESDAFITLYCPLRYENRIYRAIGDLSYKLLSEKDLLIGALVWPSYHRQRKSA